MMVDELFFQVFRNVYLFSIIFKYVQNSRLGYNLLSNYSNSIIFNNKKLLSLKISSFIYNNNNNNNNNNDNSIESIESISKSKIITLNQFKLIFNHFKNKNKINNNLNEIIYNILLYNNNENKDEILEFILSSTSATTSMTSHQCIDILKNSEINLSNSTKSIQFIINSIKNEKKEIILSLLITSMEFQRIEFYKPLFEILIQKEEEEEEEENKRKKLKLNGMNYNNNILIILIKEIVNNGSIEMCELFINQFKDKEIEKNKLISSELISFNESSFKNIEMSIKTYCLLIFKSSSMTTACSIHKPFDKFFYLNQCSINSYLPLIEFFNKNLILKDSSLDNIIYNVKDLTSLKYLIENRNSFKPPLKFDTRRLLSSSCSIKNYNCSLPNLELPKFIIEFNDNYQGQEWGVDLQQQQQPINSNLIDLNSCFEYYNTTFEIIKYFFKISNGCSNKYRFTDDVIPFNGYGGNLELLEFIIEKHNNDDPQVNITYRSLDKVCEFGYLELVKFILKNQKNLKISKNVINYSIRSGNLEIVELIKNIIPTPTSPSPTTPTNLILQDSSIDYIFKNNRNDLLFSILNSIYKTILIKKLKNNNKNNNYKIPKNFGII